MLSPGAIRLLPNGEVEITAVIRRVDRRLDRSTAVDPQRHACTGATAGHAGRADHVQPSLRTPLLTNPSRFVFFLIGVPDDGQSAGHGRQV